MPPLQILITTITGNDFKGRIATGRIYNGVIKTGQDIAHINREGKITKCRIMALMTFFGLERIEVQEAVAGDVVAIAGIPDINIGETIADLNNPIALPLLSIEEPTVKMTFCVNDSPFAGKEGQFTTSRQIRDRLHKELETDMALKVEDSDMGNWIVSGRGELHLAILIERLRREGYELQVSRPQVIVKEVDGKKMTPYEQVFIEVPEEYAGVVIQKLGSRHGEMREMRNENGSHSEFIIPTRGLFGLEQNSLPTLRVWVLSTQFFINICPTRPIGANANRAR